MNYFTKEELEDISLKLIENPTRETLKELNDKYNKEEKVEETTINNDVIAPSSENQTENNSTIENHNMWELPTPVSNDTVVPSEIPVPVSNIKGTK